MTAQEILDKVYEKSYLFQMAYKVDADTVVLSRSAFTTLKMDAAPYLAFTQPQNEVKLMGMKIVSSSDVEKDYVQVFKSES